MRGGRSASATPFLNQALRVAAKAGGLRCPGSKRGSFGRGRAASLAAGRLLGDRSRGTIIKASVVLQLRTPGALDAHLRYLECDGVTRDQGARSAVRRRGRDPRRPFVRRTLGRRPPSLPLHPLIRGRVGQDRGGAYVPENERQTTPVIGQLIARGLDEKLKGTAYAIVDGGHGRAHHVRLPGLEVVGDGQRGAIVELRRFADATDRQWLPLAVRSDLDLAARATARSAT
jgi:hypothetical protein